MRQLKIFALIMFCFIFILSSIASASESNVTFACPEPVKIQFTNGPNFQAFAQIQVIKGEWPPFIMDGNSSTNQINKLEAAYRIKNSPVNSYIKCVYSTGNQSTPLILTNASDREWLGYCHFTNTGNDACIGSVKYCQLECDIA